MKIYIAGSISRDTILLLEKGSNEFGDIFGNDVVECDGGAGANVAFYLKKIFNIDPVFLSCVGNDFIGSELLNKFEINNIDISKIQIINGQKSTRHIILYNNSELSKIYIFSGAIKKFLLQDNLRDTLTINDFFYLAPVRESTAKYVLNYLKDLSAKIIYNPGAALFSKKEILIKNLKYIYCLFFNENEILSYSDKKNIFSAANFFLKRGVTIINVTVGKHGAFSFEGNNCYYSPGYRTQVRNVIGCGDIFSSGYLGSFILENDYRKAVSTGNILSSIASTYKTIRDFEISNKDILKFLDNHIDKNNYDMGCNNIFNLYYC